jgi:D-alanyl-D-alanine dipeptidase
MPSSEDYIDISQFPHVKVDLIYATANNFTGEVLYEKHWKPLLHWSAAEKFKRATKILQQKKSGWFFLVNDALRPVSVQRKMWSHVVNTPQQIYVADPARGSMHNFGLALDLTLADEAGRAVDMGTPVDSFEELAQPRHEERFLNEGRLTKKHIEMRKLLRETMLEAGFLTIPHEWWHFNSIEIVAAREHYTMIE